MVPTPRLTIEDREARIGADLRRLRIDARLTQVELAQRAGIGVSTLQGLERGQGSTVSSLIRVLRALDREEWMDQLAPSRQPVTDPMALLRQRQAAAAPRRVRRPRPEPGSAAQVADAVHTS
jgi:transcriptional regulator with XRE-family HTH domain